MPDIPFIEAAAARDMTRLFRTLSDDTRFRLLRLLWKDELTVNELARITQLAQPRISNHLKILREERLIVERRDGSWRHYRVDGDTLEDLARVIWPILEASWREDSHFAADDARLAQVLADRADEDRDSFFDELAGRWDDIRSSLFGDAIGREILLSFLPPGLVVADIGTGTGYTLQLFGKRAARLIAIDNSEAMLERARQNAEAAGLDNVEFRLVDAEDEPLRPGEADVITVVQVLHHFEKPGESLAKFARGLKPNGRLIVSDFLDHGEAWLREHLRHRWNGFPRARLIEWIEDAGLVLESFEVLPGRWYQPPDGHRFFVPDGFTAVARRTA